MSHTAATRPQFIISLWHANILFVFCSLLSTLLTVLLSGIITPIFWRDFSSLGVPQKGKSFWLSLNATSFLSLHSHFPVGFWALGYPESCSSPMVRIRDTLLSLSPCRQLLASEESHFHLVSSFPVLLHEGWLLARQLAQPSSADGDRYLLLCEGRGRKWLPSFDMGLWKGERMKASFQVHLRKIFTRCIYF